MPQVNSKHISDFPFEDTILPWQQQTSFRQVYQTNDSIRLQLRSDTGPITWELVKCGGVIQSTDNFDQVLENADVPGEFIYQADIDLGSVPAGYYQLKIVVGSPAQVTLVSEIIEISDTIENSLLLSYRNSSFKDDIVFETGFSPSIRIKGAIFYKEPGSKDVVYEDQVLNETMIDSKSFDLYELQLTDELGIPDWLIRKLNIILGCDELIVDGRFYAKAEGAKLEQIQFDGYPMRGWKIDLREQLNRRAKYFSSVGDTLQGLAVILNTDSKGFVDDETGGSVYQITDIQ